MRRRPLCFLYKYSKKGVVLLNKDINAYVGEIDDTTAIVTITDGKIVSVVVGKDKLEFSDYGTTVINLPKAA